MVDDDDPRRPIAFDGGVEGHDYYLVRREGRRVLIDDWDWSGERVRGWAEAKRLRRGPPIAARTFTTECKCCPASVHVPINQDTRRVRVRANSPIRTALDGPIVARLPGAEYPLLARLGADALVLVENRARWLSTALVFGWVAWDAIENPPEVPAGHRVVLTQPTDKPAIVARLGVRAESSWGTPIDVEGRRLSPTELRLPSVFIADENYPFVEDSLGYPRCSPFGDRDFFRFQAIDGALRCGIGPHPHQVVRVTTPDGLGVPNVRIGGPFGSRNIWDRHRLAFVWTGDDGRARLPRVIPDATPLVAQAPGYGRVRLGDQRAVEPIVHLSIPRPRVLAGSVARDARGRCPTTEVTWTREKASDYLAVSPDCRFLFVGPAEPGVLAWSNSPSDSRSFGQEDAVDLCLGQRCQSSVPSAWLFVRAADDHDHLVATARFRARVDGVEVGGCRGPVGACFLRDLPAGQEVLIEASTPVGQGRARITPRAGTVAEVTVPLVPVP